MNSVPASISRVRFNPTPQIYSIPPGPAAASVSGPGVPLPACNNMYGGASSSGFNFSFQIPSFESLFGNTNNQFVKILVGFLILGFLGWVLHRWYRSKLQRDSNRSFLCPSWIMGKPSNQSCGISNNGIGLTGGAQPAASVSEAASKKNQTAPGEQTAVAQVRKESFGQAIQGPVGERDTNGYTRWDDRTLNPKGNGSAASTRGVNQEYEKCLGSNPDREEVCDFWKNLESTPGVRQSKNNRRSSSNSSKKNRQVYHPPMDFNATGMFASGMDPNWGPYARF